MKSKTKITLSTKIDITLKKNGKVVYHTRKRSGRAVVEIFQIDVLPEWTLGRVTVTYPAGKDFWNAGDFSTIDQLRVLLAQFNEKKLVEAFS